MSFRFAYFFMFFQCLTDAWGASPSKLPPLRVKINAAGFPLLLLMLAFFFCVPLD